MEGRREADPAGVFHLFERIFDMGLGPAAQNDLFRCPVVVICTEDTFAQADAFEIFKSDGIYPKGKVQSPTCVMDFGFKDLNGVLARGNSIQPFFQGLFAIAFSPRLRLLTLQELLTELSKGGSFFTQGCLDAGDLASQQLLAAGDHDGARLAPNFFGRSIRVDPFESGLDKGMKLAQG